MTDTKATFLGGPIDGEKIIIPGKPEIHTLHGFAPREHRLSLITYRRTNDWLKDGSVVYRYESEVAVATD